MGIPVLIMHGLILILVLVVHVHVTAIEDRIRDDTVLLHVRVRVRGVHPLTWTLLWQSKQATLT
jgi:hypothetical protein